MTAMPPADLDPQTAVVEIDFVVNHNQIPRRYTEGLTGRADTRATTIHVCLGQEDRHFLTGQSSDAVKSLVAFALEGYSCALGGQAGDHEANIVAGGGVFLAGIPQPYDQLQEDKTYSSVASSAP